MEQAKKMKSKDKKKTCPKGKSFLIEKF